VAGDVAIVIVTYNSAQVILPLLQSLPAALGSLTAETVIVDNGSTDGTRQLLADRPDCLLVESSNVGYAAGINLGVRTLDPSGPILILNPDVILSADAVPRMVAVLDDPSVGIVAPRITLPGGQLYHSLRREPSIPRTIGLTRLRWPIFAEFINDDAVYERPVDVDWALGAVLLFSRRCFDAVGGWFEPYFLYSEETEFCLRAGDLGLRTRYEPSAVSMHIGGGSGQTPATHAMRIVNRVRCYRRRHALLPSWAFFGLTLLRELSWIPRAGRRSWVASVALVRPSTRPPELGCSDRLIPG
jgi:GT2 family glycosyltransferase